MNSAPSSRLAELIHHLELVGSEFWARKFTQQKNVTCDLNMKLALWFPYSNNRQYYLLEVETILSLI